MTQCRTLEDAVAEAIWASPANKRVVSWDSISEPIKELWRDDDRRAIAVKKLEQLRAVVNEVITNGEWTEGEQRGDWKISKEVYELARDALDDVVREKSEEPTE